LRTFTLQAEALAKLQRGGEQVVRVVHVHPGGQAVIGNVVARASGNSSATDSEQPRGGGVDEKSNQPHAKDQLPAASAQPLPEVWSEDAKRVGLPVASSRGEGAMPDARRGGP
jgi:hypothetical protein